MYIKVYILEWKWVKESIFDIKFTKKTIFKKMEKNHFFGLEISWTGYKKQFWVKDAEIAWKSC